MEEVLVLEGSWQKQLLESVLSASIVFSFIYIVLNRFKLTWGAVSFAF